MNESSIQKNSAHISVLVILTLSAFGAIIESITQNLEYWVPPLILAGIIAAWAFHITQYGSAVRRENFYFIYALILAFYHGAHDSGFFDIVVISALVMITFLTFARPIMLKIALLEYFILMFMQIYIALGTDGFVFDSLVVYRIALHTAIELGIFYILGGILRREVADAEIIRKRDSERDQVSKEIEDFLSNVSHELRTPVNVINGMSSIILKKEDRDDVKSIREAGDRLFHQIEDIQDYSEIQRNDLVIENERYMITSLLNDILAKFNMYDKAKDLDLIVDLDPMVPSMMVGDIGKLHKIMRHLLDNAVKFTKRGGIYVKISAIRREYGVNLIVEVTDTGIGMSRKDINSISNGLYQANKGRNRSTGGIGLGLYIVYGFVRIMNGFVNIDSERGKGTTVRFSIAQQVVDFTPCLKLEPGMDRRVAVYEKPDSYSMAALRGFYQSMAMNIATGLSLLIHSAGSLEELKTIIADENITHLFIGDEEYAESPSYFDVLAMNGMTIAVSAPEGFKAAPGSKVVVMPQPLYGYPIVRILNGYMDDLLSDGSKLEEKPELAGMRALVVDDEPMNLVVASGLFREYGMIIDTAKSGKESIDKYSKNNYDIVFMDHMMPEMDGVEAMKRIRMISSQDSRPVKIVALTANAVSGAREMFEKEGFDGFISKPIIIADFEKTMNKLTGTVQSTRKAGAV